MGNDNPRCKGITGEGTQCLNTAVSGSKYCKIHQRKYEDITTKSWWLSMPVTVRVAIIGGIFSVIAAIIALLPRIIDYFEKDKPQFIVENPIVRPDSFIYISVDNDIEIEATNLNIEIDGLLIPGLAKLEITGARPRWSFVPDLSGLPEEYLVDGSHTIRIGVPGEDYMHERQIYFSSQPLITEATITNEDSTASIVGKVASPAQIPIDTIDVNIAFLSLDGTVNRAPVSMTQDVDEEGRIIFKFSAEVHGIPQYEKTDSSYNAPFFAIEAKDRAGNAYKQTASYAKFIAPGSLNFSYGDLADIMVDGYSEPESVITPVVSVKPRVVKDVGDGSPPIVLRVRTIGGNNELYWEVKTKALKSGGFLTTIYRDGEVISSSFLDTYTDEFMLPGMDHEYQLEQTGHNGTLYRSNIAKAGKLATTFNNGTGMEFVLIETGSFSMGMDDYPYYEGHNAPYDERPAHIVEISEAIYMGVTEVTEKQWYSLMKPNSRVSNSRANYPKSRVSWNDIQDYLEKINDQDGDYIYRLPTEAEWEYACLAGLKPIFREPVTLESFDAYYAEFPGEVEPVKSKAPNPWGIFEMLGNVSEWTADWYEEDYYLRSPKINPLGPETGTHRVVRGGSYENRHRANCIGRTWNKPSDSRFEIGFRLVAIPR